jgi:ATP-binding cassette subfamily B protein
MFQLGDDVLPVSLESPKLNEESVHGERYQAEKLTRSQHVTDFHLVCQGRVRLLCRGTEQQRDVTALLLNVEDGFGADQLLLEAPLPYRAIAASAAQIACIPASALAPLLEQFPQLRQQLQRQAQERERLIFLKTATTLRSFTSHQLRQVAPYLTEERIAAGIPLAEATPAQAGQFWLRQGTVSSSLAQSHPPAVGNSWGYPESTPGDWQAQTDLRIYKLPIQHWETVKAIVPTLAVTPIGSEPAAVAPAPIADVAASSHESAFAGDGRGNIRGDIRGDIKVPALRSTPRPPSSKSGAPAKADLLVKPAPAPEPPAIKFPKPINRRLLDVLHRYPWVEQQSSSDCGAACLSMICRYWGKHFPLHVLRERANVGRAGASLKSLGNAAEGLGFHARPVRASLNRIAEQKNPWIAHWEGFHYVVVYQVRGDRVTLADPAIGRRVVSRQEFQAKWTGYALLLEPTIHLQDTEIKQASLARFLSALSPYRVLILQIILVSLLIQVFGLVTPLFTQIILDKVVVQRSLNTLNVFALGLVLFGIWGICMGAVRQYLLSYFSNRLDLTLISSFISHTLTLPLRFFESRRVGDIMTRVQENQKIQRFLIGQVVLAWLDFLTGIVYLGLMLYYNWRLTLLVLTLIPPIVLLTLGATPLLRKVSREIFSEAVEQNSSLVEMMTGIATVKAAATEREARWRWENLLTSQLNAQFRGQKLGIWLQATSGLINSLGSTMLLWYGATLVIQEQLTIGQFVAFNMMVGYVISPVLALTALWDELQEVLISVERLNDVFEARPEAAVQQAMLILPPLQGEVKFENVTFRYGEDEERNTLQNISLDVSPGQTIAIVGRSGSGKSTLVKLLQGLYHPNKGRIWIDGHDLRHVLPQSLRSQLGVVPQECFLFSGTILENITLYRSEFSLEQIVEVAKLAEAHAFIQALPLGYNTKVGERGSMLSGGQRQRIAIARALLGNPQILILDEATSSLDTESERRFQRNLAQISRDRTTFIIAHRLSTVRNADHIIVIDQGVLVEQGTHTDLMALRGLYYHLAQQQLDL